VRDDFVQNIINQQIYSNYPSIPSTPKSSPRDKQKNITRNFQKRPMFSKKLRDVLEKNSVVFFGEETSC
jgi:hypothetical protein